jgi:hypothetical protein
MMLVFSRWTMWVLAGALFFGCNQASGPLSLPAAVGRPAEASQGPRVGVIVARGGEVTVVPSKGAGFPGLPEQQLLRDDKLVTAANSFVVVQLHNGHLVRLGASQSNVVEMLAPFHDPPAADDVEARFVRLLTPDERDDPQLSGAITRVAGWNTRMSASESFAALPTAEQANVEAAPRIAAGTPPSLQPDESSKNEEQESPPETDSNRDRGRPEGKSDKKSASSSPPPPPPSPSKPKADPVEIGGAPGTGPDGGTAPPKDDGDSAPPRLPGTLKFRPASGGQAQTIALPEPLKSGAAALAQCAGAGAKITGSIKDHKLATLKVDGAPKCQQLLTKASTLEDGSFELTVTP